MRKINDRTLLEMADAGTEQQAIAEHFGCSPAAVCKRLKTLRQAAARPAVMDRLTAKEQTFVLEVASGQSKTAAAMAAFDCSSLDSAKTIGIRLAKDADIAEAITAVMASEGLTKRHLVRRLKDHVDNDADPGVSLRAVDLGLKLHDVYPANKNLNLNVNVELDHPFDLEMFRSAKKEN